MILKHLALFALLVLVQKSSAEVTFSSGVINEYADRVIQLVGPAMRKNGFDPFKIENISHDFWFKPLFINYTGHIDLKNGQFKGLSTLRRSGDVKVKYEKKLLTLYMDLIVDALSIDFDHTLKVFNIGPSGHLTSKVKKQTIQFGLLVDFDRLTFHLQQFALTKNEWVDIHMTGLGLGDILVNLIANALTPFFKGPVITGIGKQIRSAIESAIEKLPPLLPPAPEKMSPEDFIKRLESFAYGIASDSEYSRLNDLD